ncbi:MAG: hypothetical protein P8X82_12660 [Gemmatimonadales bacterium]
MQHVDEAILNAYLDGELEDQGAGSGERGADRPHLPGSRAGSGERGVETVGEIEAHLASCAECSALLAEVKRVRDRASEILSSSTPVDIEIPPFEEIRARSAARGSSSRVVQLSRIRKLAWAATVVLAVAVGWYARGTVVPGSGELGAGSREQMTAPQPTTTASRPDEERAGSREREAEGGSGETEESATPVVAAELDQAAELSDRDVSARGAAAETLTTTEVAAPGIVAGVPSRAKAEPELEAKAVAEDQVVPRQRRADSVARLRAQPPQVVAQQVAAENVVQPRDAAPVGGVLLFADVGWTDVNEVEARTMLGGEVPTVEELPVIDYATQRQPAQVVVRVRQRLESGGVVELLVTRSAEKDAATRRLAAANEPAEREEAGGDPANVIVIQVGEYTVVLHGNMSVEQLRELGERVR